jgi:hypothetical protein
MHGRCCLNPGTGTDSGSALEKNLVGKLELSREVPGEVQDEAAKEVGILAVKAVERLAGEGD